MGGRPEIRCGATAGQTLKAGAVCGHLPQNHDNGLAQILEVLGIGGQGCAVPQHLTLHSESMHGAFPPCFIQPGLDTEQAGCVLHLAGLSDASWTARLIRVGCGWPILSLRRIQGGLEVCAFESTRSVVSDYRTPVRGFGSQWLSPVGEKTGRVDRESRRTVRFTARYQKRVTRTRLAVTEVVADNSARVTILAPTRALGGQTRMQNPIFRRDVRRNNKPATFMLQEFWSDAFLACISGGEMADKGQAELAVETMRLTIAG